MSKDIKGFAKIHDVARFAAMTHLTLGLDADTAGSVKHLTDTWGVSAEEAVCRAVKSVDAVLNAGPIDRVEAFKELQRLLELTPEKQRHGKRRFVTRAAELVGDDPSRHKLPRFRTA